MGGLLGGDRDSTLTVTTYVGGSVALYTTLGGTLDLSNATQLIDPKYRASFVEAERNARSVEDMTRLLELAKKYIAQRTVIDLLGIQE